MTRSPWFRLGPWHAAGAMAVALAGAPPTRAQSVCRPAPSTSEARLLAFYAGPLAFAADAGALGLDRGSVVVAGDLTYLPDPPAAIQASSGACGFAKPEHSGLAPAFPRPRVAVGLGHGVTVEASWLPPVTVADATPHLAALAISWMAPSRLPHGARLAFRAHATLGGVNGPITCPASELQTSSAAGDCYGTRPSDDTYSPNTVGAEAVALHEMGRASWYVGAGANHAGARLQVNFTDQRGFTDRNVVEIGLLRAAVLGGFTWQARPGVHLAAQLYSVPNDATTGRVGLSWRVR